MRESVALVGVQRATDAEVLFDAFSRGRYSTDASIYQIEPIGVVIPRDEQDVEIALQVAADAGVPVLPRGGGTSQCGQTVGEALVMDCSRHLNGLVAFDAEARTAVFQPVSSGAPAQTVAQRTICSRAFR